MFPLKRFKAKNIFQMTYRHFSLKTFGLMHFTVIDTPIMNPTKGFLICVSLSVSKKMLEYKNLIL